MQNELLTCDQVQEIVPLTTSTIYRLMRSGKFPQPIKIGGRNVRWIRSEIMDYLKSRPRATGEVEQAA